MGVKAFYQRFDFVLQFMHNGYLFIIAPEDHPYYTWYLSSGFLANSNIEL